MLLKCEYCGSPISESDKICPVCGADLVAAHEQITREKDQAEDQKIEDAIQKRQETADRRLKPIKTYAKTAMIRGIITAVVMIGVLVYLKTSVIDKWETEKTAKEATKTSLLSEEPATFNEWANTKALRFKIDQYSIYEMSYDGDGILIPLKYERLAIHFVIEPLSTSSNISFKVDDIACIADGMVQQESEVPDDLDKFQVIEGDFAGVDVMKDCEISSGKGIEGWIAYEIPQSKKTLEFRLPNGKRIVMDNPCYEE